MYYKLTNQKLQTGNKFQWKLGKWVEALGAPDRGLCTDSWLHCYDSPLLAVLHNPIHANITNPRLFEVEGLGVIKDNNGIKRGCQKMRLVKEILVPTVTQEQCVAYGILCAKMVCTLPTFVSWADRWLSGEDRSKVAAARAATAAAREATATTAAKAVRTATQEAQAASRAAAAAEAVAWAAAAAAAAWAAAWAAEAAAWAAEAVRTNKPINLIELAEQATN